ncbi:MAG: phosphohydrolase [Desulfobacterales bacterium RIFOXYA12_FULL_46_15]|nr:MAG: phosphohydrolase [Desulfobacterales bacterium RIFOXYA12_FULL_46_15]
MKCPGQDTQYWNKEAIFETECPECGQPMEFFKDDATRRCSNCHKKIVNPNMDFGCASYCKFAEQCLGTLPEEFVAKRDDLFKDRVAVEMKRYLGADFKRIGHAAKVANFAEKIGKKEKANLPVVLCAAYLYDIGVKNALEKYGSDMPEYIEKESPEVAEALMKKMGAKKELTAEIIEIVGNHNRPAENGGLNQKVLYDADQLTYMSACEKKADVDDIEFAARLDQIFMTAAGKELARQVLIETQ